MEGGFDTLTARYGVQSHTIHEWLTANADRRRRKAEQAREKARERRLSTSARPAAAAPDDDWAITQFFTVQRRRGRDHSVGASEETWTVLSSIKLSTLLDLNGESSSSPAIDGQEEGEATRLNWLTAGIWPRSSEQPASPPAIARRCAPAARPAPGRERRRPVRVEQPAAPAEAPEIEIELNLGALELQPSAPELRHKPTQFSAIIL